MESESDPTMAYCMDKQNIFIVQRDYLFEGIGMLIINKEMCTIREVINSDEINEINLKISEYVGQTKPSSDAYNCMKCIKKYLMSDFYYSMKYNLLFSRERLNKIGKEGKSFNWKTIDNEYYWNFNMYKIFDVPARWRTICIQGYFYIEQQELVDQVKVKLGILSRRQYKRGGTRLNARGIDDEGYVGNFVETESFMILNGILYIFTQIRGSIPLYWKQEGIKGSVKFKRDPMFSLKALK